MTTLSEGVWLRKLASGPALVPDEALGSSENLTLLHLEKQGLVQRRRHATLPAWEFHLVETEAEDEIDVNLDEEDDDLFTGILD